MAELREFEFSRRSSVSSKRFIASGFRTFVLMAGLAMLTACRNLTGEG